MKGVRFYEEECGTVVAVDTQIGAWWDGRQVMYEAVGAVFSRSNSPVCLDSVSEDYIREDCKRISEARARAIHPALFEVLDYEPNGA